MNGIECFFMQTLTEDMLKKNPCNICHANFMKSNKVTCKVLQLSQVTHQYRYRPWDKWIESSPVEKDLEIQVDE